MWRDFGNPMNFHTDTSASYCFLLVPQTLKPPQLEFSQALNVSESHQWFPSHSCFFLSVILLPGAVCDRRFLVVFVVVLLLASTTNGHSSYQNRIPNKGKGALSCGAYGHLSCLSSLGLTSFGHDFKHENKRWTETLCTMDSDGDGSTNGDEVGDGCCEWSQGDDPWHTTGITDPGKSSSRTSRASCKLDGE
jgi:hypothetical protein